MTGFEHFDCHFFITYKKEKRIFIVGTHIIIDVISYTKICLKCVFLMIVLNMATGVKGSSYPI